MPRPYFPLGKIIDAIVAFIVSRHERRLLDDQDAPEAELDTRMKHRTEMWDGKQHHKIFIKGE